MQGNTHSAHQRACKSRRGGALIASLIVATLLAGLGAGLVQVQTSITRRQTSSIDLTRAMYMAEAGLAEAFIALAQGKSGVIAGEDHPAALGGGLFWVEATEGADGQIKLKSTGIIERSHASLESVVQRSVSPFGRLGFFGVEEVTLRKGARVLADGDKPALVRSNGDIFMSPALGGNLIEGCVVAGTEGLIAIGPGGHVTAGMEQAKRAANLPEILIPSLPLGDLENALKGSHVNIGPGGLSVDEIQVNSGQAVRLVGPLVLVTRNLTAEPGGTFLVDASSGPVVLHVLNEVSLQEKSTWQHEAGSPSDVSLFVHGAMPMDWSVGGVFRGAIVALEQDLALTTALDFKGSIAVQRLEILKGVEVHGSEDTVTAIAGIPSVPALVAWKFSDAPDAEILSGLSAPKTWLKKNKVTPKKSSDAAKENEVSLQYITEDGAVGVYHGQAADFDLSKAKSLVKQVWLDGQVGPGKSGQKPMPLRAFAKPKGVRSSGHHDGKDKCSDSDSDSDSKSKSHSKSHSKSKSKSKSDSDD